MVTRSAGLCLVAACLSWKGGESGWGHRPIGWQGSIPWCSNPTLLEGSAFAVVDGYLVARATGKSRFRCEDGSTASVNARPIARLTIDGDARATLADPPYYQVHAFAAGGEELELGDMADEVEWSASVGSMDLIPRCNDGNFGLGCADHSDQRALNIAAPGAVTITVTLAGVRAARLVTVVAN